MKFYYNPYVVTTHKRLIGQLKTYVETDFLTLTKLLSKVPYKKLFEVHELIWDQNT